MTQPLGFEGQSEIVSDITTTLLTLLPEGWLRLQIDYRAVGDNVAGDGLLFLDGQRVAGVDLPEEIHDRFAALRKGMAHPERGTWFQTTYWLEQPGSASITYEWQEMPAWDPPPSAEDCARELELHPRSADAVPDWMRERLTR
ncbi:hypothetical protein J4573_27645 [Actinomadura barringtoniae]|uniref:Uncharacterized protein n=1 Tax=Actinomadura barringtoniae TaxID=1427535 RepID=A0A939PJD4_9ACTN|nr:hypothetical protein [Actinomadura barringtoniae]MBO2450899.1 hypothetical protein [Actinomadura barringtoniae]